MPFSNILQKLRKELNITQEEMAKRTGISRSTLGMYEAGKREPNFETLEILADFFNVDMNTLLDKTNPKLPTLSPKEERQIESDLEDMFHSMASAAYEGDNEFEDIEAFKATIKSAMLQAKRIAKKKYTPKKYQKD